MTYEEYRAALIEGFYQNQLETLMSGYRKDRPTVILLPGIMGSQLERTNNPYPSDIAVISDIIWMDVGIALKKDALKLEIDGAGRDTGSYVVAAYGALSFWSETPYNELRDLARNEQWNYAVFGFDWRRPLSESAEYFKTFVRDFRQRVIDIYGQKWDPLPRLTVVCHSMGGLVATAALRDQNFSGLGFHAVATFGTPFYGSVTAQNAFYVGLPSLNGLYTAPVMAGLIASMPGAYTLMFLPREVYNQDGPKLGLNKYPEYDPNGNIPVDPYGPDATVIRRWPKKVKNHLQYLLDAKQQLIDIASPINANIATAFFNIRSSLDKNTAVEVAWNSIDGDNYKPGTDPSPLTGVGGQPGGDGTVPAWSAWHAYCHSNNRHELKQAKVHGALLEHPEVLGVIKSIVKQGRLPSAAKPIAKTIGVTVKTKPVATRKKMEKAVALWAKCVEAKKPPPSEMLEGAVRRAIIIDIMNGPKPPMAKSRAKPNRRKK
ncbi:hypothetical protein C2U70_00805 [Bradyrhizobium guangdongense]|uniref:alpha/beta fold hydrolase n=1 Tax=Bradyrhizobium guangdongense TaxID=1325090 RepID=UPI00112B51D2|nr:alpha/beta fold hydrolase [Bradyrhizobium guangdongense]TPQ42830.1 hypothetical protein C2U70_00805 [Bradyrhizobium guangdongense]